MLELGYDQDAKLTAQHSGSKKKKRIKDASEPK